MDEFALIAQYFRHIGRRSDLVTLGIGDDCALIRSGEQQLAICTDTLVAGTHFFANADPARIGWKALAVNVSDVGAMGAKPLAFVCALTHPDGDAQWCAAFADGVRAAAEHFGCELIGGDTTRGPLSITITAFGIIAATPLYRHGAQHGDDVYVTGTLGDAALALRLLCNGMPCDMALRDALEKPLPPTVLARQLAGVAHAAIDISDGLVQDLGHVATASNVGITLWRDTVPMSVAVQNAVAADDDWSLVLAGGDDYALAFCAPVSARAVVASAAATTQTLVTRVGCIDNGRGVRVATTCGTDGEVPTVSGYRHF